MPRIRKAQDVEKEEIVESTETTAELEGQILAKIDTIWSLENTINEEDLLSLIRIDRLWLEDKDRDTISGAQKQYNSTQQKLRKLVKCFNNFSSKLELNLSDTFNKKILETIRKDLDELETHIELLTYSSDDVKKIFKTISDSMNVTSYAEWLKDKSMYKTLLSVIRNITNDDKLNEQEKLEKSKEYIIWYVENTVRLTILKGLLVSIYLENNKLEWDGIKETVKKVSEKINDIVNKLSKYYDTSIDIDELKVKINDILENTEEDENVEDSRQKIIYKDIIKTLRETVSIKEETIDLEDLTLDNIKEFVSEENDKWNTYKLYNYLFTNVDAYKQAIEAQKYIDMLYATFILDVLSTINLLSARLYGLCIWIDSKDEGGNMIDIEKQEEVVTNILYERIWYFFYVIIAVWVIWVLLTNHHLHNVGYILLAIFTLMLVLWLYAIFREPNIYKRKPGKWMAIFGIVQFVIWVLSLFVLSISYTSLVQNLFDWLTKVWHMAGVLQEKNDNLTSELAQKTFNLAHTKQSLQETQGELEDTQGKLNTCQTDKSNILGVVDKTRSALDQVSEALKQTYNRYSMDQYDDGHNNEKDGNNINNETNESGDNTIPNVEMNSGK